jgi:hypothetical protein
MKREIILAVVFCMAGMMLSFVPILYKNNWMILHDGHPVKLFGE